MWCTDGRPVACEIRKYYNRVTAQICANETAFTLQHHVLHRIVCHHSDSQMTEMYTYGLRRVCVWIVRRVDPSVCSQHGIEHSVASDHPMIWRKNDEAITLN